MHNLAYLAIFEEVELALLQKALDAAHKEWGRAVAGESRSTWCVSECVAAGAQVWEGRVGRERDAGCLMLLPINTPDISSTLTPILSTSRCRHHEYAR